MSRELSSVFKHAKNRARFEFLLSQRPAFYRHRPHQAKLCSLCAVKKQLFDSETEKPRVDANYPT